MKNKVLVNLIVPEIDCSFDVFLPVNEIVWKIKKMLVKSINDLNYNCLDMDKRYVLLNKETNEIYYNNDIIINTNIRNATELVLIQEK